MSEPIQPQPNHTKGLEVVYKDAGHISQIIGRLSNDSIGFNLQMLTPKDIFRSIPKDRAEEIKDRVKDVQWNGSPIVYLNHSPLFDQLKRLFSKERRTNAFARLFVGLPDVINNAIYSKFTRMDYYSPWTEAVTTFHPNKAIGYHEIGHALDYDQSKHPTLRALIYTMPFVTSFMEWKASNNAMKFLKPKERAGALKILEPAWGTYAGFDAMKLALPALALFPPAAPILASGPLLGLIAGHIHSRLPGRHNIFFNDEPLEQPKVQAVKQTQPLFTPALQPALVPVRG